MNNPQQYMQPGPNNPQNPYRVMSTPQSRIPPGNGNPQYQPQNGNNNPQYQPQSGINNLQYQPQTGNGNPQYQPQNGNGNQPNVPNQSQIRLPLQNMQNGINAPNQPQMQLPQQNIQNFPMQQQPGPFRNQQIQQPMGPPPSQMPPMMNQAQPQMRPPQQQMLQQQIPQQQIPQQQIPPPQNRQSGQLPAPTRNIQIQPPMMNQSQPQMHPNMNQPQPQMRPPQQQLPQPVNGHPNQLPGGPLPPQSEQRAGGAPALLPNPQALQPRTSIAPPPAFYQTNGPPGFPPTSQPPLNPQQPILGPGGTPMPPQIAAQSGPNQVLPQQPPFMPYQQPPTGGAPPPQGVGMPVFGAAPQQPFSADYNPAAAPAASKPRIDPSTMPNPIAVQTNDARVWENKEYRTSDHTRERAVPPLVTTLVREVDDGCCLPRFMRATTYALPATDDLAKTSMVSIGLVTQPLAEKRPGEAPIAVVNHGPQGPIRCSRCKAYVNPLMRWVNNGRLFVCNFCYFENTVSPEYYSALDMNGLRIDLANRPELYNGSVEFEVSAEYCQKPPVPVHVVFAIEATVSAVQSGMVQVACDALKELARMVKDGKHVAGLPAGAKIAIIAFHREVHFFNLKSESLSGPQRLIVSDVADLFVPLHDGFFVDIRESYDGILELLDMLPSLMSTSKPQDACVGAVLTGLLDTMKRTGGRVVVFQTQLSNYGPGALSKRDDPKLLDTDKERSLYQPAEFFWRKLGQDLAISGVCVDLFIGATAGYVDTASLGAGVSAVTGGELVYYANFSAAKDGTRLFEDVLQLMSREFGYDALMRVRCSNGFKISAYTGNYYMKNSTDVELAGLDSSKAFGIQLQHESKLQDNTVSSFQLALLYTAADGRRLVRVHNLQLPNTTALSNVYKYVEMDTLITLQSKITAAQLTDRPISTVKEELVNMMIKLLATYRKYCASSSSPAQMVLPDSCKLLPLYTLCLLKSRLLRRGNETPYDARVASMLSYKSWGVYDCISYLYPRMLDLSALSDAGNRPVVTQPPPLNEGQEFKGYIGDTSPLTGQIILPSMCRPSSKSLVETGLFLLEDGYDMYIWIGSKVERPLLQQLFGADAIEKVNISLKYLPEVKTPLNERLRVILGFLQSQRQRHLDLHLLRQNMDPYVEAELGAHLVEDRNFELSDYLDFLCGVHRHIQVAVQELQ